MTYTEKLESIIANLLEVVDGEHYGLSEELREEYLQKYGVDVFDLK